MTGRVGSGSSRVAAFLLFLSFPICIIKPESNLGLANLAPGCEKQGLWEGRVGLLPGL